MQIKSLFLTIILLFPLTFAYGQFYLTGENPATVKWSKIESNNYTIIFPREIDSLGIRYLWLLENNRDMLQIGRAHV